MTLAENKKRNKKAAGALVASAVLATAGSLAFFTDYDFASFADDKNPNVEIGSENPVDIVPNDDGITGTEDNHPKDDVVDDDTKHDGTTDEEISARWARINAVALANYNPGDEIALPVQLYNGGDFPIDVRETFVITALDKEGNPIDLTDNNLEFRLRGTSEAADSATGAAYVDFAPKNGYAFDTDADGFMVADEDITVADNQVVYKLDAHRMDTWEEVIRDFYLIFDQHSMNRFQGAQVKVDVIIEAKQTNYVDAQNPGDPELGWTTVATDSFQLGGTDYSGYVPVKGELAD